jgi:uncharacterized protein YqhQ
MKKIFFGLFIGLALLFSVTPATAIDLGIEKAKQAADTAGYDAVNTDETTLAKNIGSFIRGILTISGVIFTSLIFYAGYLWMTAEGDEGQVDKAKNIVQTSIIGLVLALASFGITSFVMKTIVTKTVPTTAP